MPSPCDLTPAPKCATCGTAVPSDAPLGQCPACLMDGADAAADDPWPLQELPRRFGDYELLRQVGCGGMGLVYEARQLSTSRRVALKMIRPDLASPKFLRRFLIEGEAAARLDHPNIIPIHELQPDGTESFFSMPFIDGESLKEKIRRGELGCQTRAVADATAERPGRERALAKLMAEVARAVHHAHERGVFHRDLKPGNILVDAAGQPHIADFGVAKILHELPAVEAQSTLTVAGATLGTPEYMAPEQTTGPVSGGAAAIAAADLYSLGVILYELLTGRLPFRGQSHLETLQKVREGNFKRPRSLQPTVARDLETICLKCLEKNPRARYPSAGALADDLERWLRGEPVLARPASVPTRLRRWVKSNPLGAALLVSLLFGLVVSLSLIAVLADRMRRAEINKALERETYLQKINDWWALPAITNILLPASLLAEIRDQPARTFVEGRDVRLRFGLSVDQDPITRAYNVASFLGELEKKMGETLGGGVFIDLYLSKSSHLNTQPLLSGEADVQRLDALAYVQARALQPGLTPLLIENDADEIVFCVLQDSGIFRLDQLAGKSVGFGDTDSADTVLAEYGLLTNGVRRADLRALEHFSARPVVSTTRLPELGLAEIMTDMREVKSGREALRYLLEGRVDVAVTPKRYYETRRYRGAGLRLIHRFAGMPEVFVTRAGLAPEVGLAFQSAMLSLEHSPGLGTLSSIRIVTGVLATNDTYFDGLRLALTHVQQQLAPIQKQTPERATNPAAPMK